MLSEADVSQFVMKHNNECVPSLRDDYDSPMNCFRNVPEMLLRLTFSAL